MSKKQKKGDSCLNCNQELKGENYCPNCGQKNDTRRLTFWDMLAESFTNTFALDSKIFNSLKPLFFSPGKLTKEYVSGKRTQFIHPIRLYLGASIILFTVLSLITETPNNVHINNNDSDTTQVEESIIEPESYESDSINDYTRMGILIETEPEPELNAEEALDSLGIPKTFSKKLTYNFLQNAHKLNQTNEQDKFNNHLLSKLPIAIFIFLPLFALALRLVYVRRDFYYLDHLIFTFHNVALLFFMWTVVFLIGLIDGTEDISTKIMFLVFAVYTVFAMKKFYKQGWGKTILKYIIINILGLVMSLFFLVLTLVIILATY